MHKYQPRVHIIKKKDHTASLLNLKSEEFRTFIFPETVFTAVTAYQNQLVSGSFAVRFLHKGFPGTQNRSSFGMTECQHQSIMSPGVMYCISYLLGLCSVVQTVWWLLPNLNPPQCAFCRELLLLPFPPLAEAWVIVLTSTHLYTAVPVTNPWDTLWG